MVRTIFGTFIGRILATVFIAVCAYLGFGPQELAPMILGGIDSVLLARAVFIALGLATFSFLLAPHIRRWWQKPPIFEVLFSDDGRYCISNNGIKTYRVDLLNRGPTQNDVSYRLESIQNADGTYFPVQHGRAGMQREDGSGPCPLSTDSPKYGRLVRLNERNPKSKIEVLTLAPLKDGYEDAPIFLERGTYTITVSLNPPRGSPNRKKFLVSVDGGLLRVRPASEISA
jgi:hypothetical protein